MYYYRRTFYVIYIQIYIRRKALSVEYTTSEISVKDFNFYIQIKENICFTYSKFRMPYAFFSRGRYNRYMQASIYHKVKLMTCKTPLKSRGFFFFFLKQKSLLYWALVMAIRPRKTEQPKSKQEAGETSKVVVAMAAEQVEVIKPTQ